MGGLRELHEFKSERVQSRKRGNDRMKMDI